MDILPMFPLNLVAFPGESINLHIFEHRYRQLVHEAEVNDITFGIPCIYEGEIQEHCPELALKEIVKTYPDGKMDITVECIGLLKIHEFFEKSPQKLYPVAEIERLSYDFTSDNNELKEVMKMASELYDLLDVKNVSLELSGNSKLSKIIHKIGLSFEQELDLQKLKSEVEKIQYIKQHLTQFLPTVRRTEEIKTKAALNGHFKHLTPLL